MSVEDYLKEEFGTLSHLIALHAAEQPDHVALVLDDRSVTYAELDAVADRVAAAMQRDGGTIRGKPFAVPRNWNP